jgi:signal recognition particle GTPase
VFDLIEEIPQILGPHVSKFFLPAFYILIGAGYAIWSTSKIFFYRWRYRSEKARRESLEHEVKELKGRFELIETCDNHWLRPVPGDKPAFVSRSDRKTRFVSFLNLKGGVGKTTIAASVGYCLAAKEKRILMVDMDFQYTLSRLAAGGNDLKFLQEHSTSDRLFTADPDEDPVKLPSRSARR